MRRDQLEHAIRTACQIIGHPDVIVVGSQAILVDVAFIECHGGVEARPDRPGAVPQRDHVGEPPQAPDGEQCPDRAEPRGMPAGHLCDGEETERQEQHAQHQGELLALV